VSLAKYREKRTFDKTPEPEPSLPRDAAPHPLTFCIQRHHASHLHYDLRLEVDGVLKSWAVPKGPTLDPAEKRLAMMVEDHPLEYGAFEGVIPRGDGPKRNYGAGSVMLWDRGTYQLLGDATAEQQLARGDFKFHLSGEKLNGDFAIVRTKRGKGNEWLLLKKKDADAHTGWNAEDHAYSVVSGRTQEEIAQNLPAKPSSKTVELPIISPMLAQIGKGDPPTGSGWLYEIKWDGVRAICYIQNGRLRMLTRNGNAMERQYPELSVLPHHVKAKTAILDGEIAALDARGLPSFELLQSRINVSEASAIATLSRNLPVVIFLFDLLYLDGRDLRGEPLSERKRLLKEILDPTDIIRYSDHFAGSGAELLAAAKAQGLEGIVAKRASSFYESRRTSDWIKFKLVSTDAFVLCGMIKGEREPFGALALGIYDHGKLKWAGNVGTGFDRKKMDAIHAKLAPLATEKCPLEPEKDLPKKGVIWTRPETVCEVRFSNWTDDGKLRAPVWIGLRSDIDPQECTRDQSEPAPAEGKTLLDPSKSEETLTVDEHRLKFTNLNKLYYPADKVAKRDVLNYYDAVAPLILPHLKDRPLSLKRYPNGIDEDFFFQKEVAPSFPKWLHTSEVDGITYVIGDDRATLLFLVNLGCIDQNPGMSRVGNLDHPDYMLLDLDPQGCTYEKIVEAAHVVKAKLDLAELESYPKTTGGDGMHIFVPLAAQYTFDQVRSLAELLSHLVAAERPDLFTTPRAVAKREKGKVYFDWQQIARGKTISAPYVLRAYPGAPVATPLAWREVTPRLRPDQFNIRNALARFDRVGDLFAPVLDSNQEIEPALQKLSAHL
jgi:bifunctional non-homologous end joining protein LigD